MTRGGKESPKTPSYKKRARRQARFVRALSWYGTIHAAARAAGVSRDVAQRWLDDYSDDFRDRCIEALVIHAERSKRTHRPAAVSWPILDKAAGGRQRDTGKDRVLQRAFSGHGPSLHLLMRQAQRQQDLIYYGEDPWLSDEVAGKLLEDLEREADARLAAKTPPG